MGFLTQWKTYLDELPRSRDTHFSGKRLDPTIFEKVSFCTRHYSVLTSDSLKDVQRTSGAIVRTHACDEGSVEACSDGSSVVSYTT